MALSTRKPGLKVIKLISTHLSIKYIMLINVKMPTIVGILTFISMINTAFKGLKARNVSIFQPFSSFATNNKGSHRRIPAVWSAPLYLPSAKYSYQTGLIPNHHVLASICSWVIFSLTRPETLKMGFLASMLIWAATRHNLPSGCPTREGSIWHSQLQRLARILKFWIYKVAASTIRLCGCAGWSTLFMFACNKVRFCCEETHNIKLCYWNIMEQK